MKYWIFQNNQVLGPYEPDEMGKISVFTPESLVCPEGRRGTSMGDWQRAGMVPDLSVALVRASASSGKTVTLSIAGLPPEPTLKDLAQLGSIQEKVAMLEEVVLQLQEGLRAKDAELSSVHQELAGKSREASEIKSEALERQREADLLKRQIAGLEERLASVKIISETLDKAVEEERKVEADVEKQGQTLLDLSKELEELRRQLEEKKNRAPEPAPFAPPAPSMNATIPSMPAPLPSMTSPAPLPDIAPPPPLPAPPPPLPAPTPASLSTTPAPDAAPMEFPTVNAAPLPSFEAPASEPAPSPAPTPVPIPGGFESGPFASPGGADPAFAVAAGEAAPLDASATAPAAEAAPATPAKGKKALLLGAALGVAALAAVAVMGGFVPGLRKPKAPPAVLEPAPLPPPEPAPAPPPPDPRQLAIDLAKAWKLPGDRTLERALEDLAPSNGNLSPWMADPLAGNRVQVNYFARSTAPGAPTIAYEFEVDLEGKTLVGRNAAAKSVLTGKAAPPPAPPKPKPVKVKPKPVKKAPEEDTLDSMLGEEPAKAPAKAGKPAKDASANPADVAPPSEFGSGSTLTDPGDAPAAIPGVDESAAAEAPAPKAKGGAGAAKRANKSKGKAKGGKSAPKDQPADENLLDDLLKD